MRPGQQRGHLSARKSPAPTVSFYYPYNKQRKEW